MVVMVPIEYPHSLHLSAIEAYIFPSPLTWIININTITPTLNLKQPGCQQGNDILFEPDHGCYNYNTFLTYVFHCLLISGLITSMNLAEMTSMRH